MPRITGWKKATNQENAWVGNFKRGFVELSIQGTTGNYQLFFINLDMGASGYVKGTQATTLEKARRKAANWMRKHPRG